MGEEFKRKVTWTLKGAGKIWSYGDGWLGKGILHRQNNGGKGEADGHIEACL